MNTSRKMAFCLILGVLFAFLPIAGASADSGRYFIKSTKGFWRNALGVRHSFDNGFTTDASDFQLRLAKVFGVSIEPVPVLQILPEQPVAQPLPSQTVADEKSQTPTVLPAETVIPVPATQGGTHGDKAKGGAVARLLPFDQTPWGIEVIYDDPSIAFGYGGEGVNVAVLDTGIFTDHLDLSRRIAQCKDFTNLRFPVVDGKCDDKNGHGTHVAGIIAADAGEDGRGIYGVAPQANLFAYKVCGTNGSCYADDIAAALRLAVEQGAHVVNMSFGSDQQSSLIADAVSYAYSNGLLLVAAAGNDGPFPDSIDYPAANSSVMAIGAINQSQTVADWSSRGTNSDSTPWVIEERDVEFAAPGEYIESTWNNGGYVILSGTSMASPFVVGLAAKYWQFLANNQADATRSLLHSLASDLFPLGDDDASGFGLPQVQ